MANEIGKRYRCEKCGSEFIVTKAGTGAITCCEQKMELKKQLVQKRRLYLMSSQLGKRYKCEVCNTEILCIKAGEGQVTCCGKEVKLQEPKPIPSSD